jgi:hypothetical protein
MQTCLKIKLQTVDDVVTMSEGVYSSLALYLASLEESGEIDPEEANSNARRIKEERAALDSYDLQMLAMRWKARLLASLDLGSLIPCVRFTPEQDLKVHFSLLEAETLTMLELTDLSLRLDLEAPSLEELRDCLDLSQLHRSGCLLNGRGEIYTFEYDDLVEWLCFH